MSLFSLLVYLLPTGTEIYGSVGSSDSCNLLANQTCREITSATNTGTVIESEPKSTETPLILPDISPTDDDLSSDEQDDDGNLDTKDNDDAETTDSTQDNLITDKESEKETSNDGGDDSSEDSSLPFP
jgi:hypothetical protein